jgi:hypothetical protein
MYLDRGPEGWPLYVGYGESPARDIAHINAANNGEFEKRLARGGYHLEIAGPFEPREVALAVEIALISALRTTFNVASGHTRWRFRPSASR